MIDSNQYSKIVRALPFLMSANSQLVRKFQGKSCILTANAILSDTSFPDIVPIDGGWLTR